jgi:hypothetical protein
LAIPFTLAFQNPKPSLARRRQKQNLTSPGGSFDFHVYIDAISIPQGIPHEFKARNQVAAGFKWHYFGGLLSIRT